MRYLQGNLRLLSPKFIHRIVFITLISVINSLFAILEDLLFRRKIEQQAVLPPVFVLGHPRTGTTHLHNILSVDRNLGYVTTFQAGFPNAFLILERFAFLFQWLIDSRRPMDNLPLNFSTPAEDEIAVNVITGGISPYASLSFMPRYKHYLRYCTFEDCTEESPEMEIWIKSFLWFLKKVSFASGGKRLVIKSPVHMGRIKIFLKLFPKSNFVFIHRDCVKVFQSNVHMAQTYFSYCYLTAASNQDITSYILEQHRLLYKAYLEDRDRIPAEALCEISFDELENDASGTLEKIYNTFGWDNLADTQSRLKEYLCQLENFRKNDHMKLDPKLLKRVQSSCQFVMKRFGEESLS